MLGSRFMSVCLSVCLSVCSAFIKHIFIIFNIRVIFENILGKFKFQWNMTRITGSWREDLCAVVLMHRWIRLRMRNVSDKFAEKVKLHILCPNAVFRKSCRLWDNVETIWCDQTGHGRQYNIAHSRCLLDKQSYRYTLRICNNYCFPRGKKIYYAKVL
jgi:hypothetical protein